MTYRALLIDHDDTLLSTFALRARVWVTAVREVLARDIDGPTYLASTHGRNLEQMAADFSDDPARIHQLTETYRRHYYAQNGAGLEVYAGIADTLRTLRLRGVPVAVVTSKLGRGASEELRAAGLHAYVDTVVGAEHVRRPKPDPEPLHLALEQLGCAAAHALMVGDTSADVHGARAAGVAGAAALWGTHDRAALLAAGPDHRLEHPADLLHLLRP